MLSLSSFLFIYLWGQTRKSGMTVLGKVPKPINLPSQRLENHGLDPNVEIVPKGTLTWGSRASLAGPNAWGSSSLSSPNTDGSTSSPNGLSGRPSSGGSYTRPSTATSDRSHQAVSGAWSSNSRPSSASGILPSDQAPVVATRPRSAETRHGSSQRSCFGESVPEGSAWGPSRIPEKLVTASKLNTFNLSSGDFPTLGSEKTSKSNVPQEGDSSQGRPASASGRVTAEKETVEFLPVGNEILSKGNVNAWRNDNSPHVGGGTPQNSDNWKRDQQQMQPYQNTNSLPPYQFDSWHGTPMANSPDGIWYRGPPPGGMFRPGGPGSYPVDPYAFYPQLPMRPLSNPQAGPGHGNVMASYGPMNGPPYHPHPPDSHMAMHRPLSPRRPDVYPGRAHNDSHYSPPSFSNVSERDGPVLGMAPLQSTLYNQHPGQKSKGDIGDLHEAPFYNAPPRAGKEVDDGHPHDSHRPRFKVLLKQHDRWKDNDSVEKKDQSVTSGASQLEIKDHSLAPEPALQEGDKDETAKMAPGVAHQSDKESRIHPSIPAIQNKIVPSIKSETVADRHANASGQGEDPKRWPVKKSSALIEKIESLNNKARVVDGRSAVPGAVKEDREKPFKNVNNKADTTQVTDTVPAVPEKSSTDPVLENLVSVGDAIPAPPACVKARSGASEVHAPSASLLGPVVGSTAHSQVHRKSHNQQNRMDHHSKSRFNGKNGEEWKNKSPGSSVIDNTENSPEARVEDHRPCQDVTEKKELHDTKINEKAFIVSSMDSVDLKAQHARMKEIARQRAKQLQKEEEERIREQKARALAKLEELNRRTAAESSNQPLHHAPSTETQPHQDMTKCPDSKHSTADDKAPVRLSDPANAAVPPKTHHKVKTLGSPKEGVVVVPEEPVDSSSQTVSQSVTRDNPPASEVPAAVEAQSDPQFQHNGPSKQKQTLQRRRHHNLEEKHVSEKDISDGVLVGSIVVSSKHLTESAIPGGSTGVEAPAAEKDVDESLTHHKKRNSRIMRNRSKPEEAPSSIVSKPSQKAPEKGPAVEEGRPKPSEAPAKDGAVQQEGPDGAAVRVQKSAGALPTAPPNQVFSRATEEAPPKSTLQWKPQHPRKITRNPQAARPADKFHGAEAVVWAPVKSTGKKELAEEAQIVADEAISDPSAKSSSDVEHNLKFKRAEMERYVPKPIAQELLSQQMPATSHHQPAPSAPKAPISSQGAASSGTGHSANLKAEPSGDTTGRESTKPSKNSKAHASWRRRVPPELPSPLLGSSLKSSSFSNSKNNAEEEQGDPQKEQAKSSDDGWKVDRHQVVVQSEPVTAAAGVEKDSARLGRGRRPPFRGHKVVASGGGTRENWEPASHGRTDRAVGQLITIESDETSGRRVVRHESDHPRSHWQLKSQHNSSSDPETRGGGGAQKVFSQVNGPDSESSLPGGSSHPQPPVENKISPAAAIPVSAEARTARRHAERRERRAGEEPSPRASSAAAAAATGLAPVDPEAKHEPVSSVPHRRGQQQQKGWAATTAQHEAGTEQEGGGKHSRSVNADRRKLYLRSGYSKQESSSQHSSSSGSVPESGARAAGKYRERAAHHHSQPRHHVAHLQIPISGQPQ
ncbi:unnamed protein product [Spirodela intermedia]|uniref:BAT2 N-terminal domain-containing protein n=1 Tax=Spirodela intermedia TaxID=51605 RepID=A0A7I8LJ10_SPIIN|nr:unnamed protein product [Spirodela intermedia]